MVLNWLCGAAVSLESRGISEKPFVYLNVLLTAVLIKELFVLLTNGGGAFRVECFSLNIWVLVCFLHPAWFLYLILFYFSFWQKLLKSLELSTSFTHEPELICNMTGLRTKVMQSKYRIRSHKRLQSFKINSSLNLFLQKAWGSPLNPNSTV